MKKIAVLFTLLLATATTITSCSKDEDTPPPSTALEVIVVDDLENPVAGATLELRDIDASDPDAVVATGVTDAAGKYTFKSGLKSTRYYVFAEGAEGTCKIGEAITETAIPANQTTTLNLTALAYGALIFDNVSTTKSYNVYIKLGNDYAKINPQPFTPEMGQQQFAWFVGQWTIKYVELDNANNETTISSEVNYVITECTNTPANFGS